MKFLHIVPCIDEANGVYRVACFIAQKQVADGHEAKVLTAREFSSSTFNLHLIDEVYVHGMWLPSEWLACWKVLRTQKSNHHSSTSTSHFDSIPRLVRMTHGSLSPVYLEHQGKWKKRLATPIERWLFSKTDRVVTTGDWETEWCRKWGLKNEIEVVDVKQFFKLKYEVEVEQRTGRALHVLYLGHIHPLKGYQYLERAVKEVNLHSSTSTSHFNSLELRIESNLFGEEKEAAWNWCDVFCLPTLSENFGLVVAEALEHGKRVIVTDGAQAWKPTPKASEVEKIGGGGEWWEHIIYLKGYVAADAATRVKMLKDALEKELKG